MITTVWLHHEAGVMQCPVCKLFPDDDDGHDPCIRNLPGVKNACCGHGGEGYAEFENGVVLRGTFEPAPHAENKE